MKARLGLLLTTTLSCFILYSCMSQEQQEQMLQNSELQSVSVTVNVGGDSRAERFLGTFDQISRLSLDIDRNYGNKRVLTDFPLVNDGSKWTGTINKLIVGFDYTITGHAYKCIGCIDSSKIFEYGPDTEVINFAGTQEDSIFRYPYGITGLNDTIYVSDSIHRIYKISINTGEVSILAGSGNRGSDDGQGTNASFNQPRGMTIIDNYLYVLDARNSRIRMIDTLNGIVSTFVTGLSMPSGITNFDGFFYVTNTNNHEILKINIQTKHVEIFAGTSVPGHQDGDSSSAKFNYPFGITNDGDFLYISDPSNLRIRKISLETGNVSTLSGSGTQGNVDGSNNIAKFNRPNGISLYGNFLYLADENNNRIRKIDKYSGEVTTIHIQNGRIVDVVGIGNFLYFTDYDNHKIGKLISSEYNVLNQTNNISLEEIFRGDTQHTVTEGTNSLSLRLSPLLDDRELTVPRITRINRPFQMVASTSDNITVAVNTVKKDGSSAVDATLSYRFRSVDNDSLPLDNITGGSFSPSEGNVTKSGSSYPDISTTYTAPEKDSTMKLQVRVSNELEIGVTSHFNVYVTDDIETQNTVDTNPVITNLSAERIDSNRLKWTINVSDDEAFSSLDVKWEYLFGDNRTFTEIDPTEYDANSGKMQAIMEAYSDSDDGMLLVTVCETDVSGYSGCAYQNEGSTSMQFELIPNAFQAPIICDGSECSNVPAWFDGDYIACETTSGLPQRITMSLQSGVGSQTIEYLDQVSGNCEGNLVAKIEIKSHYTSDNNSSISIGSDNITVTKATNTIDSTKMTFYNLNYVSAFQMDNASNLCGNSYWAGITHEVSGWCELKGGSYLPGSGATNKAIYSVLDNGTMLGQFSHQTHPVLLDTQGYPTTINCTGGFGPQADGVFTDMGCPLPFKPNIKSELQTAVNLWVNDKQSAIMFYGDISGWDTSLITDMSALFQEKSSFNDDISNWDVSNVENFGDMFVQANSFKGDLSNWDVSSANNMAAMFASASLFNSDLSNWNVSNVRGLNWMFSGASSFKGDLSDWDVSNVEVIDHMFFNAISFNSDISSWNLSNVTNMSNMLSNTLGMSTQNKCTIFQSFGSHPEWSTAAATDWSQYCN